VKETFSRVPARTTVPKGGHTVGPPRRAGWAPTCITWDKLNAPGVGLLFGNQCIA
jgi:hypothetical protein